MRITVTRLGIAAALVTLIALAPAAAASASVGGPTPPVPTGPGSPGFPPIQLPPADPHQVAFIVQNYTNCTMVLERDNLTAGYYHGKPPQVVQSGTKIIADQATATGSVSGVIDYGIVCDLVIGEPVVAQGAIELAFDLPETGPAYWKASVLSGDFTVTASNSSLIPGSPWIDVDIT
ncbi:hypothetical protein GCM10023322_09990 [Rugosimonospora acidiphila]|uniref:Secreted protein n=1 Tax=Rugosimonospora acidiphila TaxID=556531 RepID=A0ABP9RLR2_9ACTN